MICKNNSTKISDNNAYTYPYAIDDNGNPVFINEITKENKSQTHYHCYGCGAELFPVLGDVREHHFRHEKGSVCDPNKYLHEYAKAAIKKRFEENDSFIVSYHAKQVCKNVSNCVFYDKYHWRECDCEGLHSVDLKKFYDTCTSEKGYYQLLPDGRKKYIADLFLTDSQNDKRQPVCIEVWVTHECTDDKKQNGGRIIEIKINDEKDAVREIVENDDEEHPIRFFNFANPISVEPGKWFRHIKRMPGLYGKVLVIDNNLCSDGLQYDPKAEKEVILSSNNLDPIYQEVLYAIKSHEDGMKYPTPFLCEYGNIIKNQEKYQLKCRYLGYNRHCPCGNYKFSTRKREEVLEQCDNVFCWGKNDVP